MIQVAIIDKDTLRALGLKHLIERYFDMHTAIASHPSEIDVSNTTATTTFFTTPQCYIASLDFFISRRSRTVILSDETAEQLPMLNPKQDESNIIHDLSTIISKQDSGTDRPHNTLSQRETDVLRLIAMGYINKEIAEKLSISFNTVLTHRKNITAKLGIRSVSGLGFYAMMNGYITENDITDK